ncbi:MAG TPA: FtsX-like permease family protein [Gaiellaceae bacterium]|nr:FtsX-like permease family protein [Gaiellaceae bacterium]
MLSASLRKSINDLSRRRARTIFTVATLALAVASFSFFAIPPLIDRAMQEEVRSGRLADVTVTMRPVPLGDEQLDELARIPNVAAVEARNSVDIRVLVGERRAAARVIGVRDFADQGVDVVRVESGSLPRAGELLADVQNANVGLHDGSAGDSVRTVAAAGGGAAGESFRISGRGRSLPGGEQVQDENVIVFYATAETVARLSGEPGYGTLAFRLRDPGSAAAGQTIGRVRASLREAPGFAGFANLPEVRPPGEWPGKGETERFAQLLGVITAFALLSALVLISNTMTTLVGEQTREIGIMRAVGARRRQVALVYLRTALLLGALGAAVGVVVGIVLSNLLAAYFARTFWAVDVGFGVDPAVLLVSVLVGLVAPPLAALPAIRRGVGTDLREALEASGSASGSQAGGDRLLRSLAFLPRTMQIGLRNLGQRTRRSLATVTMVALAVGNLLAFLGVAAAATDASRASWADHLEDVRVWTSGSKPFDAEADRTIRDTPGVASVQPALVNEVELSGHDAFVWGVPREPLFRYRIAEGRWFGAEEERAREPVAVIERNLADAAGAEVGEHVTLATAAGSARFRITGIADNQQEDGTVLFVPLTTLRALLERPSGTTTYWIETTSSRQDVVDRTAAAVEDRLAALGYEVGSEITYVAERDEIAANSSLTSTITVLGLLIVAISMVGLANAITTSVLERTREVGILRSLGARSRDVRRIFTTEAVALALGGWLLGVPLGYLLDRLLVRFIWEVIDVRLPVVFPPWNIAVALVGAVVLSLAITALPIRRATRLRPGEALRYA